MPMTGAWRVFYSLMSAVGTNEANHAYIYFNNMPLPPSYHDSWSENGFLDTTSGREVNVKASAGDSIRFKADRMDGKFWYISFCVEFIPGSMGIVQVETIS